MTGEDILLGIALTVALATASQILANKLRVPALIVLLPLQAFIGEYQWHNQLPWWVVLAHVSVAAAAWIACVSLATRVVARRAQTL